MISAVTTEIPVEAMVSISGRRHFIFLNDRLRQLGLSARRVLVSMQVFREQNLMQKTLVRHYPPDKGTIAQAVKKPDDARYIRQIVDPGNRGAVRLSFTGKGKKTAPVLQCVEHEWEDRVCSGLSRDGQGTLKNLLRTITGNSRMAPRKQGDFSRADE